MPRSSLITKPVKPIRSRITSPIIAGEVLAGRRSSKAGNSTWAVMARGAWRSAWKGRKSTAASSEGAASMRGRARWLSAVARPWPGTCLMTGSTPPARQPADDRPPQGDHRLGIGAVGAVADDLMRSFLRHVENRHGVDGDAQIVKLLGGQSRPGEGGARRHLRDRSRTTAHNGARAACSANRAAAGAAPGPLPDR